NNTATGSTTVVTAAAGADVTVTVAPPANAAPGATVNVQVTMANLGPEDGADMSYTLTLPPNLTGVACSGNGVTCTYASGTGVVTIDTGLPTALPTGQSLPFTLTYTAPA